MLLTADSTGSGEKTTAGKKGILCRIKSIQICIIFFLGIPRLRNMFLTFKTPKPDISAFCCSVLILLQIFVQGCPPVIHQIFPSHPVLATRFATRCREGAQNTTGISMNGSRGLFSLLAVPTFIPSYNISYISYSFQSFPSHLIQSWSQALPGNTQKLAPLQSSKSWTNAGSLSLKVLQYFPTIRFHSLVK